MSGWLKATLMVIGAVCVLLVAGASPVLGAPAVLRGGLMQLLGLLAGLLALWGGWRLAAGLRVQFVFGLVCTFFAVSGLIAAWMYGCQTVENAMLGGAMWFGAFATACTAVVGLLFAAIFGYFVRGVMRRRLWLAAAHWSCFFIVLGAFWDYCSERTATVQVTAGSGDKVTEVKTTTGEVLPLEFALQVEDFSVSYYDGAAAPADARHNRLIVKDGERYLPFIWMNGRWVSLPEGHLKQEGEELVLGKRRYAPASFVQPEGVAYPYLLISEPLPAGVQGGGAVKEYRVACTVYTDHRGRPETRHEVLKVNEPIACKDWHIYLLSYHYNHAENTVSVVLQARNAPGRWFALVGMVGLMLSTACWCWWRREESADVMERKELVEA